LKNHDRKHRPEYLDKSFDVFVFSKEITLPILDHILSLLNEAKDIVDYFIGLVNKILRRVAFSSC